jgi:uncharacterized BrkB/YihY/UPF0761 family membrane protein
MKKNSEVKNTLIISYLTLRKAVGILGISLPFVVALGAWIIHQTRIQESISAYYYTGMRDVFVGMLWAIGFFLLSYKGYERADTIASILGGIFSIGVALFPTAPENPTGKQQLIEAIHMTFAALFFFTLIYFSFFLFTKTDPKKTPTRRKLQRNIIYRVCGIVMAACILLMTIYFILPNRDTSPITALNPEFWLETIAIEAFGISWLVKGETILKDEVKKAT